MSPSLPQILIILAIVLLIFGPKKIPGIGKALGEAIRGFKKGVSGDGERDVTPENEKLDESSSSTSSATSETKQSESEKNS